MDDWYEESKKIQEMMGLDDPVTRDLAVEEIWVPMRDGTKLYTERWFPKEGGNGLPVALIRSPYKFKGGIRDQLAKPLAERGFQTVLQSIRGLENSEGENYPFGDETQDGLDTIEWIKSHEWFGGSIIMHGPSYQGCVQWAIADKLPPEVKMLIPSESSTRMAQFFLKKEAYALEASAGWGLYMDCQKEDDPVERWLQICEDVQKAYWTLPLSEIDRKVFGYRVDMVQKLLSCDQGGDYSQNVSGIKVPMRIIGGWHDTFLDECLKDFVNLQKAGCPAHITIGEWSHSDPEMTILPVREAIRYGLPCARGEMPGKTGVKLYVMGADEWREYESWPPEGYGAKWYWLQTEGKLSEEKPDDQEPDAWLYDPVDPTPAAGGKRMLPFPGIPAGRVDNTELEQREDVLLYTGEQLEKDVEIIGTVYAKLWFQSSLKYADVFVRLCDVDANGISTNICDGIVGLTDADELREIRVELTPTAYRFRKGHRIRIQVSSGAFPVYNRNLGTGESVMHAVNMLKAEQKVYHDAEHLSGIVLPLREIVS